jgi:hypothetical protein
MKIYLIMSFFLLSFQVTILPLFLSYAFPKACLDFIIYCVSIKDHCSKKKGRQHLTLFSHVGWFLTLQYVYYILWGPQTKKALFITHTFRLTLGKLGELYSWNYL